MFKKWLAIFLGGVLLLTACGGNTENSSIADIGRKEQENLQEEKALKTSKKIDGLVLSWKDIAEYTEEAIPFIQTGYTPKVPAYQVAEGLTNIANLEQFDGLSEEQKNKLQSNGFVVLEPNPEKAYYYMKMYDIYEENEYKQIPNFVTVDAALHIYHKFFGETLKGVEKEQLYEALQELTVSMLDKTLRIYENTEDPKIKEDLEHMIVYFAVANQLINDSYGQIPVEMLEIAKKEIEKIQKHTGYESSPLFGFQVNYAQFTVRGHYAGDELLERYFQTMMWYGLVGHPFYKSEGALDYDFIAKSLLMTYIAFLEAEGKDDIALWDKIYGPTNFFVGQSDDITLFDLKDVIINVYGKDAAPEDFRNEAYYGKLAEEIEKLPPPQIQHKLTTGAVDTPTGKQFRFMGQRYTLDANILQEMMEPIIRPVPTGLDVVGVFGSERAKELAKKSYLQDLEPEAYETKVQKLKNKVDALSLAEWQQNLYNGWLWVLKAVWVPIGNLSGFPVFMQNQAWEDKNIQTGLGSYAELKHDTILYAKQPAAEMGGGEELQEYYPNYVEPAVEVYDRLLWLVQYAKANLRKRELLSPRSEDALNRLEQVYTLFRDCSVKQLENIPLSEEENNGLKYIGGTLEYIDDILADQYQQSIASAVISDVAGIADVGAFLEIGTGLPNDILVALYYEGKVYLARGVVYSYYEFLSGKPMTDQEWHELLGIEKVEMEEWHFERINPERLLKDAPPQPDWIGGFKSFEANHVRIPSIEYRIE